MADTDEEIGSVASDFDLYGGGLERPKPNWSAKEEAKIRKVFDQCDEDKSGTVSLAELFSGLAKDKTLARTLGIPPDAATDDKEEIEEIFAGLDTDGNAELDFEEFGYFFAERVEILRYIPDEGADATQVLLEADYQTYVVEPPYPNSVGEVHMCGVDDACAAVGVPMSEQDSGEGGKYHQMYEDVFEHVPKLVDAFSDPAKILPTLKQFGAAKAKAGCDLRVIKAHYDAIPAAMAEVAFMIGLPMSEESSALWSCLFANAFDMVKLGFEEFAVAEKGKCDAAAAKEGDNANEAEAAKKAAEEAAKAADAEKKKAEEAEKTAEKAAKAAKDDDAKAEAVKAAAAAEAAKVAAEAAKGKAEAEKVEAEAAKKAAEDAKKAAEEEAKKKQQEVEKANAERAKEDEARNVAREKVQQEKAKADAAKSDEEKAADAAKAAEAKAKAEAAKEARRKREAEEEAKKNAPTPGCACVVM